MTFSCGAGRKRQRGQTRRPWAGCCCGKLLLSFASSAVTHTHTQRKAARERNTHISSLQVHERCVACTPTDPPTDGAAGRDAEAQIHLSSYGFLSVTLDLVIEVHKGVHEYYSVAQCHQLPCTATLLSLSLSMHIARESAQAQRSLARLRFHGRARPLALLCGPTYADVARPPACPPAYALRTETFCSAHVGPRPQ
jgi:hypothetical protein